MLKRYFALHWNNCVGALRRMLRQPVGSLLTVMVIAIALALPAALRILVNNADLLSDSWEGAADFTVYLGMDVSDTQAQARGDDVKLARALDERAETDLVQVDTQWVARLRGMLELIARAVDIVTVLVGLAVGLVIR